MSQQGTIFTLSARCRDCYRCVRSCPVKAIRMHQGQAYVDKERCILCGTCIRECPQKAKTFRSDISVATDLIESGVFVAASVAPSFAAVFNGWQKKRLASALRQLGFRYVGHTSYGAYQIAAHTAQCAQEQKGHIATACPAVVSFVEKYKPELTSSLIPLVSPMTAHGLMLRKKLGPQIKIVFIGPCVAKKDEITRPENMGVIDAVLTFQELLEWFKQKDIDLANCEESDFDETAVAVAQLFPLPGGLLRTAGVDDDGLNLHVLQISGAEQIREVLNTHSLEGKNYLLEPLFCQNGCINGPAVGVEKNIFDRRKDIIKYGKELTPLTLDLEERKLFLSVFEPNPIKEIEIPEYKIQEVLAQTGKTDPSQQLNCGACGYNSCREKAVAVLEGLAEPQMCIPYMRFLAERKTDKIIETSPNGIVILDENLQIVSMNKAFRGFFKCSDNILGSNISLLMDPQPVEKLISSEKEMIKLTRHHGEADIFCHEIFYWLKEDRQIVGIFVNITHLKDNQAQIDCLRVKAAGQAKELLENQIKMAQHIVKFLGENTAQSEELIRKLTDIPGGSSDQDK